MNSLTTDCQAIADRPAQFKVYWRNGRQSAGLITVTLQNALPDPGVIAELSALHWLLGHRAVFGPTQSGKGLHLQVSAGAIRKAVRALEASEADRFAKPHLKPYARFLATRFAGATITVSKDLSGRPERTPADAVALSIRHPLPTLVDIPGLGEVEVSAHALERFGERLCMLADHDRWRLLRRVVNGPLQRVRPLPETLGRRIERAGTAGERWVNTELQWGFVVVPRLPRPVMVTAYAMPGAAGMHHEARERAS